MTPTLIAWGRRDHTLPLSEANEYARVLQRAKTYVSSGSHDWLITQPEEFFGVLRDFALTPFNERRTAMSRS